MFDNIMFDEEILFGDQSLRNFFRNGLLKIFAVVNRCDVVPALSFNLVLRVIIYDEDKNDKCTEKRNQV